MDATAILTEAQTLYEKLSQKSLFANEDKNHERVIAIVAIAKFIKDMRLGVINP